MNACCLQLDQTLLSEAARMAQTLRYHKSSNSDAIHLKTFWTVYFLEKTASFSECTSSVGFKDRRWHPSSRGCGRLTL